MVGRRFAVLALVAVASCGQKLDTGALNVFVKKTVCPADRVSVTARSDIAPHTIYTAPARTPPANITADPERLALWNSQQPATVDVDAIAKSYTVTGCGQTVLYACAHPRTDGGDGPFSVEIIEGRRAGYDIRYHTTYFASDNDNYTRAGDVLESSVVCVPANP